MNPYQIMAIVAGCMLVFAGVVSVLAVQGVPLLLAVLGVYLIAVWIMFGMQKRARELYDGDDTFAQRRHDRFSTAHNVRVYGLAESKDDVLSKKHLHA